MEDISSEMKAFVRTHYQEPAIVLISALASAAIANELVKQSFFTFPYKEYFPVLVVLFLIGRYFLFSISPNLQFGASVKQKLASTPRGSPNRYWYIDSGRIQDLYVYYNDLDSVPKSSTSSNVFSSAVTAGIGSASNAIGSSVLSEYLPSRLFEQIEPRLRHDYGVLGKQPKEGDFWFPAKLTYIGQQKNSWGTLYTVIKLDTGFECVVHVVKTNLTSQSYPFSENAAELSLKVEIFGRVGKSNNDWYVLPYVILATL